MSINETEFDPHSRLFTVYDAVHGAIDLRDPQGADLTGTGWIVQLLNSQMMERLRRIKQLGYASHSYTAADHSRYAHAIGTMHMMNGLLTHLIANKRIGQQVYEDLSASFSKTFRGSMEEKQYTLIRHMLLAALLQDIGELPYGRATSNFFKPTETLKASIKKKFGGTDWTNKDVFTVACLEKEGSKKILDNLKVDQDLLVFLITGHLKEVGRTELGGLRQLRHMLDGQVDADRLDYVFRDAYHTVGGFGMPKRVVESLQYYDSKGPVFADTGAVSDFLTLRAHLWTNVYFSPQNRFRMILLRTVLSGIQANPKCAEEFFDGMAIDGLSVREFEQLDDVSFTANLTKFYNEGKAKKLHEREVNALALLLGQGQEYVCYWLPRPKSPAPSECQLELPDDLFFDTFSDLQDQSLYEPNSIRVRSERFKHFGSTLSLEDCSGAFSGIFKGPKWSALPMPGSYLIYAPRDTSSGLWNEVHTAIEEGRLYRELMKNDPLLLDFVHDTTHRRSFQGPRIFISFRWDDLELVKTIARILCEKRRRYFVLTDHFEGDPFSTRQNSTEAVMRAEGLLVVASERYLDRFKSAPNGNIAAEINAMIVRHEEEGLVPAFLSVEGHEVLRGRLPYGDLGIQDPPNTGEALKGATHELIEAAVKFALDGIDKNWASRKKRKKQ